MDFDPDSDSKLGHLRMNSSFCIFSVTTASSRGEDLKGRITLHFSVELSNGENLSMDLPPEEFYKFCLEVEKGKQQLQLLTTTNTAQ